MSIDEHMIVLKIRELELQLEMEAGSRNGC